MYLIYSQGTYSLSASQAYKSCRTNYSSCNLTATSSNTTGCATSTSYCNGTLKTMNSTCTSTCTIFNPKDICCSEHAVSVASTTYNACGMGGGTNCAATGSFNYSKAYEYCMEELTYTGSHSCNAYANINTQECSYTINYSYTSSWVTNRTAYYSSSTLTLTSYTYARTYTANNLVYSRSYTINYTTSQVNPKTSTY